MEALVVVLGLIVVPALIAALVVALVVSRRRPVAPEVPIEELLRESAEARWPSATRRSRPPSTISSA